MKKLFCTFLSAFLCLGTVPVQAFAASSSPVIVAFGDSLTAAGVWVNNINSKYGLNIINKGVGGNNTKDGIARFNNDVLSLNPDVVIICFGMNDSAKDMAKYVPIETFKDNLRNFITTLKARDCEVILATSNYIEESLYYTRHDKNVFASVGGAAAFVDTYCQAVREIAQEQNVRLADVRKACDSYPNKMSVVTDGVHCTQLGYSLYSDLIGKQLVNTFLGDINLDGRINSADFLLVKRHFLGTYTIPSNRIEFADINKDAKINATDFLLIKRHFLGTYDIFSK